MAFRRRRRSRRGRGRRRRTFRPKRRVGGMRIGYRM